MESIDNISPFNIVAFKTIIIMEPISNFKQHKGDIVTFTRIAPTFYLSNPVINTLLNRGWGNGYIGVPITHPTSEKDYNDLEVDIHGGWTYDQQEMVEVNGVHKLMMVFGFDTAHYGDSLERWPQSAVVEEIERVVPEFLKYL